MTRAAIAVLGKNPKGYVLVVASDGEAESDAATLAAAADKRTLIVVATIRGSDAMMIKAYGPGAALAQRATGPADLHAILCKALRLPGAR